MKLIHSPLTGSVDDRVLVTVSPANLIVRPDGSIMAKNNTRVRLYFERFLLQSFGYPDTTRLKFIGLSVKTWCAFFHIGEEGCLLAPIKKGSGRSEVAIPASAITGIETFPRVRKAQCKFWVIKSKEVLAVKLPFGVEGL